MKRTEVKDAVIRTINHQYPNIDNGLKQEVVEKVSRSIRKDFYILDLQLKSEMKRRIKSEVLHGTTNRL